MALYASLWTLIQCQDKSDLNNVIWADEQKQQEIQELYNQTYMLYERLVPTGLAIHTYMCDMNL